MHGRRGSPPRWRTSHGPWAHPTNLSAIFWQGCGALRSSAEPEARCGPWGCLTCPRWNFLEGTAHLESELRFSPGEDPDRKSRGQRSHVGGEGQEAGGRATGTEPGLLLPAKGTLLGPPCPRARAGPGTAPPCFPRCLEAARSGGQPGLHGESLPRATRQKGAEPTHGPGSAAGAWGGRMGRRPLEGDSCHRKQPHPQPC